MIGAVATARQHHLEDGGGAKDAKGNGAETAKGDDGGEDDKVKNLPEELPSGGNKLVQSILNPLIFRAHATDRMSPDCKDHMTAQCCRSHF